ncbi:hypothetical protein [Laspinema olomoucense]|uniref:hypothetical protein n=1 Tax=Laspinema olomoucense TaxID=3231600 RepID=UPI0021BA4692|nr:hypothetical protein [Laspinema sp. D3c]
MSALGKPKSCPDCVHSYQWDNIEGKGWDCQHPCVGEVEQSLENSDLTYANSCSFFEIFDYKESQRMNGLILLNN